jgi:flagellar biosynthesis protein FlhF
MNVKRFTARTSREALRQVREALGEDAVVLSTKPCQGGVEVLAMAPDSIGQIEQMASDAGADAAAAKQRVESELAATSVAQDADKLAMSTLSFQDYVRNRMLKRRRAAIDADADADLQGAGTKAMRPSPVEPTSRLDIRVDDETSYPGQFPPTPAQAYAAAVAAAARDDVRPSDTAAALGQRMDSRASPLAARPPVSRGAAARDASPGAEPARATGIDTSFDPAASMRRDSDLLAEMRSMKGLIEERFGALAFMERLQRRPAEARLTQKLLDCGFSPMLVRKIADGLATDIADETAWATQILERNLLTAEASEAIEDRVGVFAMIGATGVGKTTTTAKIAAAFAAKHGAANLGLVTLDAYRVGAHEQLRAYGRILGVPVHTAHDRASLEDLLELLAGKKMVLIDTAGMAQRDARTRELLEMLSHRSIHRLLVVNAAAQGETIEDVLIAYRAPSCVGIVLSKLDEAVKLGPALDAAIRHKLKIIGIANGQRVPEDWHRLSANALVQKAMRGGGSAAWRLDAAEMNLIFAAPLGAAAHAAFAA